MNDRLWHVSAIVAFVLAVSACSSEAESVAPTVELSTTTVTTLPPSTTTTTEAPTTTEDPRIAEVEAAVAAFRETQVAVLLDPALPVSDLEAVAGGDLLQTIVNNVLADRASGDSTTGFFLEEPRQTAVEADAATHLACGLDALAGFDSSGALVVPADDTPVLRRYELARLSDSSGWVVIGIVFEGTEKTECVLDS